MYAVFAFTDCAQNRLDPSLRPLLGNPTPQDLPRLNPPDLGILQAVWARWHMPLGTCHSQSEFNSDWDSYWILGSNKRGRGGARARAPIGADQEEVYSSWDSSLRLALIRFGPGHNFSINWQAYKVRRISF